MNVFEGRIFNTVQTGTVNQLHFFIDKLGSCAITLLCWEQKQLKDGNGYICSKLGLKCVEEQEHFTLMFVKCLFHLIDFREEDNTGTQKITFPWAHIVLYQQSFVFRSIFNEKTKLNIIYLWMKGKKGICRSFLGLFLLSRKVKKKQIIYTCYTIHAQV